MQAIGSRARQSMRVFLLLSLSALIVGAEDVSANLQVSGDCNDESGPHNGLWLYMGQTASGRPYYKHSEQPYYMYYDPACDGQAEGRWVMDSEAPSVTAEADLDEDTHCFYHSRYLDSSMMPSSGVWRSYCAEVGLGWVDSNVVITQVVTTTTTT